MGHYTPMHVASPEAVCGAGARRRSAPVLLCLAGRCEMDDDLGPGGPHLHAAPPVGERALTRAAHVDK